MSFVVCTNNYLAPSSSVFQGQYYSDPSAFCGIHFFNPVLVMQLVEVIRTKDTSDRTYNAAKRFSEVRLL